MSFGDSELDALAALMSGYLDAEIDDRRPAWQHQGARHGQAELFFLVQGQDARPGKAMCQRCPCQRECLAYAIDEHINVGIWGGASPKERDALRRKGITGDLVREYGMYAVQGREVELDAAVLAYRPLE